MYTYTEPGVFTVNIEAKNGCGITKASSRLNVASGPALSFTNTDLNINIGDLVTFTQTSTSRGRKLWVFNLDLNDTSSSTVVKHKYTQIGTYTVSLFGINDFGC
ncbi:MAG: PKD repeat protein [Bacteroidia bacterium]|jgi:PKD repeat protein